MKPSDLISHQITTSKCMLFQQTATYLVLMLHVNLLCEHKVFSLRGDNGVINSRNLDNFIKKFEFEDEVCTFK